MYERPSSPPPQGEIRPAGHSPDARISANVIGDRHEHEL